MESPGASRDESIASPSLPDDEGVLVDLDMEARMETRMEATTPEPQADGQDVETETSSTPGQLPAFDWEEFQSRYEKALSEANELEREILKDANGLSKYFDAWASAASSHDDERALKRLRTRQRFINLAEEKADQRQHHYEEVVRAFESALALLQASDSGDSRPRTDQPES